MGSDELEYCIMHGEKQGGETIEKLRNDEPQVARKNLHQKVHFRYKKVCYAHFFDVHFKSALQKMTTSTINIY